MEQEQLERLLTAISDSRNESTRAIGVLSSTMAQFHGDIGARVSTLENDNASRKKWDHIKTALVPAYAIGHAILAHLGIKA